MLDDARDDVCGQTASDTPNVDSVNSSQIDAEGTTLRTVRGLSGSGYTKKSGAASGWALDASSVSREYYP